MSESDVHELSHPAVLNPKYLEVTDPQPINEISTEVDVSELIHSKYLEVVEPKSISEIAIEMKIEEEETSDCLV
ncbi:hypothetical protein V6N12_047234 [Hibiscus sabdariffa]|uniref:Uncharacterized protein n=1 Tax=Hibiscus sabdariffa TaxID=183260 RepID=A0ABR2DA97_9ROSI